VIYRPTWFIILAAILATASVMIKGLVGLGLFFMGVVLTAFFIFATWRAIQLFTSFVQAGKKPMPTMMSLFIALGFKLPIFVMLGLWLRDAEITLQACFLLGLGLVYSWVVGWATVDANKTKPTENHGRD
jgi:O-antigen/teichoic acid export membrane protein